MFNRSHHRRLDRGSGFGISCHNLFRWAKSCQNPFPVESVRSHWFRNSYRLATASRYKHQLLRVNPSRKFKIRSASQSYHCCFPSPSVNQPVDSRVRFCEPIRLQVQESVSASQSDSLVQESVSASESESWFRHGGQQVNQILVREPQSPANQSHWQKPQSPSSIRLVGSPSVSRVNQDFVSTRIRICQPIRFVDSRISFSESIRSVQEFVSPVNLSPLIQASSFRKSIAPTSDIESKSQITESMSFSLRSDSMSRRNRKTRLICDQHHWVNQTRWCESRFCESESKLVQES